jgi:DNA adenine methylase
MLDSVPCKFILSTWHHNDYRANEFIDSLWSKYSILTKEHFYHVGASEDNRNPMVEALITSFVAQSRLTAVPQVDQLTLLSEPA